MTVPVTTTVPVVASVGSMVAWALGTAVPDAEEPPWVVATGVGAVAPLGPTGVAVGWVPVSQAANSAAVKSNSMTANATVFLRK